MVSFRFPIRYGSSRWLGRCSQGLLEFLFPPACQMCGREPNVSNEADEAPRAWERSPDFCDDCLRHLAHRSNQFCRGCGLPSVQESGERCRQCRTRGFRFSRVYSLGAYEGELRQAVIRMKQFHEHPLTAAMGRLLGVRLQSEWGDDLPELIVPIPKFWLKRLARGINTADVLAESIGRTLSRPYRLNALRCIRSTRKQSLLSIAERKENAQGSLRLHRRMSWDGCDVLVVDDIMTTGATMNEAARVLRRAGARRVRVAVVGRAFPSQ